MKLACGDFDENITISIKDYKMDSYNYNDES